MDEVPIGLASNLREVSPLVPQPLHLISAVKPTPLNLHQQIPLACSWNLADIINQGVRHEENIYGYLNSLLTSIFLPSQRFQVNPQYPLRPRAPDHEKNISIGSIGEIHSGRGTEREAEMQYPDFLITKPSPRGRDEPKSRINAIIAIIEVKKSEHMDGRISKSVLTEAVNQTGTYAKRVHECGHAIQDNNSPIVASYIIYGKYYAKVIATGQGDRLNFHLEPLQHVWEELNNEGHAPLSYRFCELAVKHWDLELDY